MTNVFDEVDEQLRAERTEQMLRRGWPYATAVLAAALAIALAFWGWDSWTRNQEGKASIAYAHALDAQSSGKTADAETGYRDVAKSAPRAYRALALMQLAGLQEGKGNTKEAVALLDQAEGAASDRLMKDVAAYKAALLLLDTAPIGELQRRLEPLTGAGRPYRFMAREALGVARLAAGYGAEARGDFAVLAFSPDVSDATRARAHAALSAIDSGTAGAVAATVKAAAALPKDGPISPLALSPPSPAAAAPPAPAAQ